MTTDRKVALVAGAQGVIGRNLIEHLKTLEHWDVIGLSRRVGGDDGRVRQPCGFPASRARFGDFVFSWDYDMFADGSKARRFGFHEFVDTEKMLVEIVVDFRRRKFIP
ncbi:NAD-dependent epimerase/dehydratase family protein [Dongia soli]|uniref:NAD-dependent epimerase/dehydratase family protein n=1 Tax=Dongia soli TaxID=600628 RepID=A0ABU5E7W9_9PROT|nr:NAD-dependent epimerase/dehydratase family protein [Dongia soli]MDY0882139.1 NAD-dependent epimerase/dehydratase family protein [Dongia soli]